MRIAVLTTSYPADAADASGHFVASEVARLLAAGHEVTVLCPSQQATFAAGCPARIGLGGGSAFGWPGVLTRLRARPWRLVLVLLFCLRARRALRAAQCDRLIAHWLIPSGWPLAAAFGKATEVVIHGSDVRLFQTLPRWLRERVLARFVARGVTLRFVAETLRQQLGIGPGHPLFTQSYIAACELDLESSGELDRSELRRRLALDPDAFVAVVVGRLVPGKRVAEALQHPGAPESTQWVVVGDGPLRPELERRFPLARFVGQVPRQQALAWIRAADVLVSASRDEGAPSAIREARALGVRVWARPAGDVSIWAETDPGIELFVA